MFSAFAVSLLTRVQNIFENAHARAHVHGAGCIQCWFPRAAKLRTWVYKCYYYYNTHTHTRPVRARRTFILIPYNSRTLIELASACLLSLHLTQNTYARARTHNIFNAGAHHTTPHHAAHTVHTYLYVVYTYMLKYAQLCVHAE